MFSFFKKKEAQIDTPVSKKVKSMKCRKLNFVDTDFNELISLLDSDISNISKLVPVNYYAIKREYIMATVYTNEDYSENYLKLDRYELEHHTDKSDYYKLDFVMLAKMLSKVGIIIHKPDDGNQS